MKIRVINYLINNISLSNLLKKVLYWHKDKKAHYICISNVHSCIESFKDKRFKQAHNSSDLALPDGRPIYWALKLLGSKNAEHLPGYYITEKICELANKKNIKIGFYGSTNKNLKKIQFNLKKKYKKLQIKYSYSPPFRKLKLLESKKIIKEINKFKLDILFVCLGCPKQKLWMHEHKKNLKCIMIGIGAVADFLSGNKIFPNKFLILGFSMVDKINY